MFFWDFGIILRRTAPTQGPGPPLLTPTCGYASVLPHQRNSLTFLNAHEYYLIFLYVNEYYSLVYTKTVDSVFRAL